MKSVFKHILFLSIICAFTQLCAPARFVKPLAKKQQAVVASFGGPLINYSGAAIPVPFTTVGYGYGLTDNVTCYGNLHTTSMMFRNLQLDAGATIRLYEKEKKFGVSISPALQLAHSFVYSGTMRVWPSLDANAYYFLKGRESYLYTGVNSWFELSGYKAHKEPVSQHLLPNLNLGYVLARSKWLHQFQLGYLGLGINNLPGVVGYIGISGKGSLAFYYGLIRKF